MTGHPTGKFIVIDGPDYCGKGTQVRRLVARMMDHPLDKHKQINVFWTREPFNSEYGKEIRSLLETEKDPKQKADVFTDLYIKDRLMHLRTIVPLLERGIHVVSDRYMYSTIAYQHAQGAPLEQLVLRQGNFLLPDLSIVLMISLEEGIRRKAAARQRPYDEVFEKSSAFMAEVQNNYRAMKKTLPNHNIVEIDGDPDMDTVFGNISAHVDRLLFP